VSASKSGHLRKSNVRSILQKGKAAARGFVAVF
jgi:hypothetical protein